MPVDPQRHTVKFLLATPPLVSDMPPIYAQALRKPALEQVGFSAILLYASNASKKEILQLHLLHVIHVGSPSPVGILFVRPCEIATSSGTGRMGAPVVPPQKWETELLIPMHERLRCSLLGTRMAAHIQGVCSDHV